MYRIYPAKVTYIVNKEVLDAVVYLGPTLTDLKRFKLKGLPEIPHEYYKQVKRIISDSLHEKRVLVKVNTSIKGSLHEVWEAEFFEQPECLDDYDPCVTGLRDLVNITTRIFDKIEELIHG